MTLTKKDIKELLDDQNQQIDKNFDHLATMTQKEFLGMNRRLDDLNKGQKKLEDGQLEIKLKLDQVVYRFELVEAIKRIEFLEKKVQMLSK